jgi:N-methylhydantoinase A/oxoprolinase/acetone carboxylase beta subunit
VRIGVDTGGTFTDLVRLDATGLVVHKLRSTPDDPSRAILEGIEALATGLQPVGQIVHGSTVATNAVLERKGARVALLTTAGFEDVVRIGRQTRPALYDFFVPPPRPLVEPELTVGVHERLDAEGKALEPVVLDELPSVAADLRGRGADIVAICFLHSYANPAHERAAADALRAGGLAVCTSHEVLPEYREYERWSTTVVNAYVTPLIDRYLAALERGLGTTRLSIMQSNGGSISAAAARAQAVRTVLSGPAAGVVGARVVSRLAGYERVVSFDMGGTSTDVSLIDEDIGMSTDARVGDFPVRLPMIDIHTVGAGGGSIARMDSGGALRVGPESAGASPGPACYGVGTDLTVTDANLLLGRLDESYFLGGRMSIDVDRTRRVAKDLARRLGVRVEALAEGVVRVANANMERAIRVVSVERGHDPRQFALVAFGGAGGMHACALAAALDMRAVLVPRHAGVLSALGMLAADVVKDYSASVLRPSRGLTDMELRRRFADLTAAAERDLGREGFGSRERALDRLIDVRYTGQSYEITVPYSPGYRREFDARHLKTYGYSDPARATEVVAVRVRAAGFTPKPRLPFTRVRRKVPARPASTRPGWFEGRRVRVAHFRWPDLAPGNHARGPAVITGNEATVVIPPSFRFYVDGYGNIVGVKS